MICHNNKLHCVKKNSKRANHTSLMKSPCFLCSASIALSKIPPEVALLEYLKAVRLKIKMSCISNKIISSKMKARNILNVVLSLFFNRSKDTCSNVAIRDRVDGQAWCSNVVILIT